MRHDHSTSLLALAVLFWGFLALGAAAQETRRTGDGLVVRAAEGWDAMADRVFQAARQAKSEVTRTLGVELEADILVFVAESREQFEEYAGTGKREWAAAVARPSDRTVILDPSSFNRANPLPMILRHELSHLATRELWERGRQPGRPPVWFDEGLAQWAAGAFPLAGNRDELILAAARGEVIPLEELAAAFPGSVAEVRLAYLESIDFFRHLEGAHGRDAIRKWLEFLGKGVKWEEAFERAFGLSLSRAEQDWRSGLEPTFWEVVLAWVGRIGLYALLLLLAVFLFLVAVRRFRRRERQLREKLEKDDAWMESLPDEHWSGERWRDSLQDWEREEE